MKSKFLIALCLVQLSCQKPVSVDEQLKEIKSPAYVASKSVSGYTAIVRDSLGNAIEIKSYALYSCKVGDRLK